MALKIYLIACAIIFLTKCSSGNVIFNLNYGFKIGDDFLKVGFNNTLKIHSNALTNSNEQDNEQTINNDRFAIPTDAPETELETSSISFETFLQEDLIATRDAMLNLRQELQPLVPRYADIAGRVKTIDRYLNLVNEGLAPENTDKFSKIQVLQRFTDYLNEVLNTSSGYGTIEYYVIKRLFKQLEISELDLKIRENLSKLDTDWLSENMI